MTERTVIFIIIASAIVAITLIGAVMQIIKSISEAVAAKNTVLALDYLMDLKEQGNEIEVRDAE